MASVPEQLVLRTTLTSPFGRKTRMAVEVLGLGDRVTVVHADTADPADSLYLQNPLGQIPCLVRGDGSAVYDSSVIVECLQEVAGSEQLLPLKGPARYTALTRTRLVDGMLDAAVLMVYEPRFHPTGVESGRWLSHQQGRVMRALAVLEVSPPGLDKPTDALDIGLACVLSFFDKKHPLVDWRPTSPRLVAWLEAFAKKEPALERTRAPD